MADRCSASITIGGTLDAKHLPAFFAAIAAEGLATDFDEAAFTPADLISGEPLTLCAHEVSWGSFNILEPFCHAHQLPYTRWNGACSGCRDVGAQFTGVKQVRRRGLSLPKNMMSAKTISC